jgi:hypothetical protein
LTPADGGLRCVVLCSGTFRKQVAKARNEPSWSDLDCEFSKCAAEHPDLAAVWSWKYPSKVICYAVARSVMEGSDPQDVLKRVYERSDAPEGAAQPVASWTLQGGSPSAQHLFRVVAGRAARSLFDSNDQDPWLLWLDLLKGEGYSSEIAVQPATLRAGASQGPVLGRYPKGYEDRLIAKLFEASAHYCRVRSIAAGTEQVVGAADSKRGGGTRGRGRPPIANKIKVAALAKKVEGASNREVAKVLYHTQHPTLQQVKNVPAILKHFQRKRRGGGSSQSPQK